MNDGAVWPLSQRTAVSGGQVSTLIFSSDLSTDKFCSCNFITLHNVGAAGVFLTAKMKIVTCSQVLLMFCGWGCHTDVQLSVFQLFSWEQHSGISDPSGWELLCIAPSCWPIFLLKKKKKGNVSYTGQASSVTKCPGHFLGLNSVPKTKIKELPWEIWGFSSCTTLWSWEGRQWDYKSIGKDLAL